jgi:hypothetical protein
MPSGASTLELSTRAHAYYLSVLGPVLAVSPDLTAPSMKPTV